MSGNLRTNYVSVNKSWKTTVFVQNKDTVIQLLSNISNRLGEFFFVSQLSFTEKSTRQSITRRTKPLPTRALNTQDDFCIGIMTLHRVYLQINGLSKGTHFLGLLKNGSTVFFLNAKPLTKLKRTIVPFKLKMPC